MIDLLRFSIAMAPLGLYLVLIGYLHQRSHAMLLNAAQETLLLGMGAVGWIAIGPIELFFPDGAYSALGEWVWLILFCLYGLVVFYWALHRRPHWVVYGVPSETMRALLAQTLEEEGLEHAWLGNTFEVPELGIRASVEPANALDRATSIQTIGSRYSLVGWHRLERILADRLRVLETRGGGWPWLLVGFSMLTLSLGLMVMDLERMRTIALRLLER
jgi:hypothetical protein